MFRGFRRRIFSPHFCGKKCPEKSSRKIPGKILQSLYNKNPRHISAEGPRQHFAFALLSPLSLFNRGGSRRPFRLPGEGGDHVHCTVEPSPGHIWCRKTITQKDLEPLHNQNPPDRGQSRKIGFSKFPGSGLKKI